MQSRSRSTLSSSPDRSLSYAIVLPGLPFLDRICVVERGRKRPLPARWSSLLDSRLRPTAILLQRCAANAWPVFLLGRLPGVAEQAAAKLKHVVRGLQVAGTRHGYFGPEEEPAVAAAIRATGAQAALVGLGNPTRRHGWTATCRPPAHGSAGQLG